MTILRYQGRTLSSLALAAFILGHPGWSNGQEIPLEPHIQEIPKEPRVSVTGGIKGWLMTQGQTRWNHDFSRLTYKDDSTNIVEASGQVTFLKRWFVRGDYGYGAMGGGTLVDDDFSSSNGPLESRTTSNITGNNLWYVNGDVGVKAIQFLNGRGFAGLFTGIQYWRQEHEATGVVQTACNPVTPLCNPANIGQSIAPGQKAITNTSTWISWRVGVETTYRITKKFEIDGKFAFIPVSSLRNDDIHHLRLTNAPVAPGVVLPALAQDPSFKMTGLGMGTDLEASASYVILPRLVASVGYRFWWNWIHDGTITQYTRDFGSVSIDLNSFQTYRHGFTIGLRYTF
ncbi:MAG: hypothetical protein LV473_01870 [Nitrospira sp.]|nr:hypothetical protein [Nitrospira sp.]